MEATGTTTRRRVRWTDRRAPLDRRADRVLQPRATTARGCRASRKRAGCNVALLYRHWASKRALYVEILKSIWIDGRQGDRQHARDERRRPAASSRPTSRRA